MKTIKFASVFAIVATLSACAGVPYNAVQEKLTQKQACAETGGDWIVADNRNASHCYTQADRQTAQGALNTYAVTKRQGVVGNSSK